MRNLSKRCSQATSGDGLDAISLDTDANLTADPYYWDFVVRQPSGATPQWKDVFISIDYDVDGTGLIKIEPYRGAVPGGNLLENDNVISAERGGDAFEKILLEANENKINFDGTEYAGGTSADEGKRKTTVETPPGPICPIGLTYDPDSGLCADADDFETSEPTCPGGLSVGRYQSRLCLGGLTRNRCECAEVCRSTTIEKSVVWALEGESSGFHSASAGGWRVPGAGRSRCVLFPVGL